MAVKRNRVRNPVPFNERLQQAADQARNAARSCPVGQERDALLKKAKQAETAAHLNEWLSSRSLQSSK